MKRKPTKSEQDNHRGTYPKRFYVRVNDELLNLLDQRARDSACSPSTWIRQAIRGLVRTGVRTEDVRTGVRTVEDISKRRHPETQRRLDELFPARAIGFVPTNTDARFTACEDPLPDEELLESDEICFWLSASQDAQ
jgi:predicted transcriptional regulator